MRRAPEVWESILGLIAQLYYIWTRIEPVGVWNWFRYLVVFEYLNRLVLRLVIEEELVQRLGDCLMLDLV
jgi:hypothetical protein